jgi:hypothetical protein
MLGTWQRRVWQKPAPGIYLIYGLRQRNNSEGDDLGGPYPPALMQSTLVLAKSHVACFSLVFGNAESTY